VVFGATGAQGGSVVHSLLTDKHKWHIRGVCANRTSELARKLESVGVEMWEERLENPHNLANILHGAHAVFLVTIPEHIGLKTSELDQGKMVADAAKVAGVCQFIFSSLPNVQKESHMKYHVPAFSDKGRLQEYISNLGFKYTAFPQAAFYYENFAKFLIPKEEKGILYFTVPEVERLCAVDIRDMGPIVLEMLCDPERYNEKEVPLCGYHATPDEFVELFSKVTGKKAAIDKHKKLPPYLAEMMSWANEFGFFGNRDCQKGKEIIHLTSWEQFLNETGWYGQQEDVFKLWLNKKLDELKEACTQKCKSSGKSECHLETRKPLQAATSDFRSKTE